MLGRVLVAIIAVLLLGCQRTPTNPSPPSSGLPSADESSAPSEPPTTPSEQIIPTGATTPRGAFLVVKCGNPGDTLLCRSTALPVRAGPFYDVTRLATWASSDPSVVTVSDGIVRATGAGQATLRVTFRWPAADGGRDLTVEQRVGAYQGPVVRPHLRQSVRAWSASGGPIQGARIRITNEHDDFVVTTGQKGDVEVGIAEGVTTLKVSASGHESMERVTKKLSYSNTFVSYSHSEYFLLQPTAPGP